MSWLVPTDSLDRFSFSWYKKLWNWALYSLWKTKCQTAKRQAISIRINSVWIQNSCALLDIHWQDKCVSIIDCMVSIVIMMFDIPWYVRCFSPKPAAASLSLTFQLETRSAFLSEWMCVGINFSGPSNVSPYRESFAFVWLSDLTNHTEIRTSYLINIWTQKYRNVGEQRYINKYKAFIYSFIRLFIDLFSHLFIYSFVYVFIYSFLYLFIHFLFIYVFIYTCIHAFIYLFIHLFQHLFIHLYMYVFIYLFPHLSIHLFMHLFIYLFIPKSSLVLHSSEAWSLVSTSRLVDQSFSTSETENRLMWH